MTQSTHPILDGSVDVKLFLVSLKTTFNSKRQGDVTYQGLLRRSGIQEIKKLG